MGERFLQSCITYIQLTGDVFASNALKITWVLSYMRTGCTSTWVSRWCKGDLWRLWLNHTAGRGRSKDIFSTVQCLQHNYTPGRGRSKENKSEEPLCQSGRF